MTQYGIGKMFLLHYVYNEVKTLPVNDEPILGLLPNGLVGYKDATFNGHYFSIKRFKMNNECDLMVADEFYGGFEDTAKNIFRPPFEHVGGENLHSKIGYLRWFLDGSTGSRHAVGQEYRITYKNFCQTYWGVPWVKYTVFGVGVEEIEEEKATIYPNPVVNSFTVSAISIKSIKIVDVSGKTVHAQVVNNAEDSLVVDVSSLANGFYIVKTQTSQGVLTNRVVVQH